MSIEDRLAKWLEQPGTFVTQAEQQFISDMRNAAVDGVGYGWMQQVIEWEWQSKGPASHGPEYYHVEIERLQAALREVQRQLFALCEDTEDSQHAIAERDQEKKEGAYARGRIREAKSIRNAMGEAFRAALSGKGET